MHREQTFGCQEGGGWGRDEVGGRFQQMRKVFYKEWVNNKVLLYSTENYIQYLMVNHNGKEDYKRTQDFPGSPVFEDAVLPLQGRQIRQIPFGGTKILPAAGPKNFF